VLPSAQIQTAGETNRSRWDRARLRLVILIGLIVALAIICIAVAVLSSAQRADEVSASSQQQLITKAINEHADRTLHHLESVATTPRAVLRIRDNFDAGWVDRRLGQWLQNFYDSDVVVIFGADDQILYGLGMKVTAEGVETPDQHLFLRAAGVHSMQGYRFGRPVTAPEIDHRLAAPEDHRVASPDQEIAIGG